MNTRATHQSRPHMVAGRLAKEIETGKWPPGGQLPAMRELAGRFGSNISTIQSAMRLLESRGLVTCRPRLGAFVNDPAGRAATSREIPQNSRRAAHIALIGVMPYTTVRDGWMDRIIRAAELELMGAERYFLTRIGSALPDAKRNSQSILRQIRDLSPQMAGAIIGQQAPKATLEFMQVLDEAGLPWVTINRPTEQVIHNFVSADNIAAGRTAGRCFLLNGFEKILFLSPAMKGDHLSFDHKLTGLLMAYVHADRPIRGIQAVHCKGYLETHGYEATLAYLQTHGAPQGVYTTGDLNALGAIQALQEQEIDVPDQVSVMGSTGLEAARFSTPGLTTTPQPMEAMGRTAARMLLRMIQTGERRLPGKQIDGGLVLRESLKLSDEARRTLRDEGLLPDTQTTWTSDDHRENHPLNEIFLQEALR